MNAIWKTKRTFEKQNPDREKVKSIFCLYEKCSQDLEELVEELTGGPSSAAVTGAILISEDLKRQFSTFQKQLT